ncbi:hypothetical protein QM937_08445 [Streptococcus salivarius]|jgi:putative membrane protein|uniref:Membrane protein n=1 Tax=Streptococcus salivarius TaxID=1304 RepID=A0A074J0T8_STRSL|nr:MULTISPECIES: hypothetical protein [Streptococcus]KEO44398.1 membrane protein [Streptococcus salivarius]KEO45970.1 membrane protein [Streptococcus salivarius]MBK5024975.1 hypothetical protein [Streptococcus sp. 17.1]MBK5032937.1 hypothetical protein [Streptococcus sp. 15.1]MBK5140491.1 hypothetical protein [Streptococcus sp. 16.1]
MISIARLLLFFVITMGYNAFLRNTVKMNRSLTWVFTFSVITLVLYLGSLLGFMLQTVYVISVLGCLLSLYYLWAVWKKKYRFGRLDYIALGMMAYLLLFGITLWHSPLLHYDNFTHWATIVKFFHINNALPTQQDTIISYYTYPVGSSLFIYFFTTIVGFSEGSMLVGQFFLIASSLYAMFAALRDDRRVLMVSMIFASFAVFNTFNVAIRLNNLLVDFLLPALALAAIAGCFVYRNRFWFLSLNTAVILGLLSIVKVSGLFFVALVLVVYVVCIVRLLVRKRARLKALVLLIMTLLVSCLPFVIWQKHVTDNFPNASSAKHAVSMSELGQVLTGNLSGDPQKIITLFVKSVFTFDSLASNGILIINLIMLIAFIVIGIRLKYKKFVLLTWGFVDISIVTYYIGILLMYLTAMPTDEALELAGFERYASSIVIFAFGCLTMALAWVMDKCLYEKIISKRNARSYKSLFNKHLYQYASLVLTVYAIGMFLSENNSIVYNNNQETNEVVKEIHQFTGSQSNSSTDRILVVTADKENVDNYFVQYASRYYLWDVNVDARENFVTADQEFLDLMASYSDSATSYYLGNENIDTRDGSNLTDDDFIALLKTYDEVLILDDHYTFNALTKKLFGRTYSPGLYKVSDILAGKG